MKARLLVDHRIAVTLSGVLAALAVGCGGELEGGSTGDSSPGKDAIVIDSAVDTAKDASAAGIEIAGSWVDDFGGTHEITDDTWTMGAAMSGVFHITTFDNTARYAIAKNDDNNQFSPGLWSRFDWTHFQQVLYFCQSSFDAKTEQEAMAVQAADPTDPTAGGCGGFAWSKLTPATGG